MDDNELLKERFKLAISSATKAISENFNLEIKFGNNLSSKKDSITLPDVVSLGKLQDFTNLRAFADSEALKIKYTDNKIYLKNEPKGILAKALYSIAEKIRYEKIGSDKLKGVKNNITQCYESKFKDKKIEEIKIEADVPVTEAFELYLRNHFFKIKQNEATRKTLSYWQDLFDKNLKKKFNELDSCIENQSKFSHVIAELINNLEFEDSDSKETDEKKETAADDSSSPENNNEENNSTDNREDQKNNAEFNVTENIFGTLNENEDLSQKDTKKVTEDLNLRKKSLKSLLKNKYKIFTN